MINKTKLTGLLMLLLVISVFAGAVPALATNYAVKINTFDSNYNEMSVDNADVYKGVAFDELVAHQSNVKSPVFSLIDGVYKVVVQSNGFEDEVTYINVEGDDAEFTAIMYALPDQGGQDNQGGDSQGGQDNQGGEVNPEMKIKLDINDDEVKPGDNIELEVELDNNLGYKAKDVVIEVTVFDIDDGDDLDDETEEFDLSDDREKTEDFTFMVPYNADEDSYDIEVEVTWEDKEGNDFTNTLSGEIVDVEKEKHDVAVVSTYLGSVTVAPGKTTEIAVDLANIGKNDEDVRVKIESADLNVEEWSAMFELDEGETATQYIPFNVPSNMEAGKYFVNAIVYFNDGANSDSEFVTLTIGDDSGVTGAVSLTPVVTTVATEGAGDFGTSGDTYTIGALVVGILLLLAVIVIVGKEVLPRRATIVESTKRRRR